LTVDEYVRLLIVGDTHGNTRWLREYIFPVALTTEADAVVVLGDFGAWEHTPAGTVFMDAVGDLAHYSGTPLYWLPGNHDKFSQTVELYGDQGNAAGFLTCRSHVFYIPQGHTWSWGGVSFRSFGGAYSVDKKWRLEREARTYEKLLRERRYRVQATGLEPPPVPPQRGTLWFPEEEMTDGEIDALLQADSSTKMVVLSHDKPYSSKPGWDRKNLPECLPNQLRLERALRAHRPSWWFHGHLHYHYVDRVLGSDWATTVVGLEPDDNASERGWKQTHTWALADLVDGKIEVRLGEQVYLDSEVMQDYITKLG
jgi:hypothetical protein